MLWSPNAWCNCLSTLCPPFCQVSLAAWVLPVLPKFCQCDCATVVWGEGWGIGNNASNLELIIAFKYVQSWTFNRPRNNISMSQQCHLDLWRRVVREGFVTSQHWKYETSTSIIVRKCNWKYLERLGTIRQKSKKVRWDNLVGDRDGCTPTGKEQFLFDDKTHLHHLLSCQDLIDATKSCPWKDAVRYCSRF